MLPLITAILPVIGEVIDRVIPDKEAAAKAKIEMQKSMMENEHAITLAQLEINKEEAKNDNLFVSGWRPAVGWLGVLALLWVYIIHPLLAWASINLGWQAPPEVDTTVILQILTGLLGFGALRTFEKTKGVARESLKKKLKPALPQARLTMEPIE